MNMSAPLLKNSYLQRAINEQKSRLCYHLTFQYTQINIKSILWNYPCTLNLLRQKCYCYHHHYSPHHDHPDNHLHHPNYYCWGIVIGIVVIVVNDIVILFIDIAILGTYYSGIAGKIGKLNFGFGFFFLHSVKIHTQAC